MVYGALIILQVMTFLNEYSLLLAYDHDARNMLIGLPLSGHS